MAHRSVRGRPAIENYISDTLIKYKFLEINGDESLGLPLKTLVDNFTRIVFQEIFEKNDLIETKSLERVCKEACSEFMQKFDIDVRKALRSGLSDEVLEEALSDELCRLRHLIKESFHAFSKNRIRLQEILWRCRGYISIISASKPLLKSQGRKRDMKRESDENVEFGFESARVGGIYLLDIFAKMIHEDVCFISDENVEDWMILLSGLPLEETCQLDLFDENFWGNCLRLLMEGCKEDCIRMILSELGKIPALRDKGGNIKRAIQDFIENSYELIVKENLSSGVRHYFLRDLFNLMVYQHAVLEYELFSFFANAGVACMPRARIFGKNVDLIVFSHRIQGDDISLSPAICIEVTSSEEQKKIDGDSDKLRWIRERLREPFPSAGDIRGFVVTAGQVVAV